MSPRRESVLTLSPSQTNHLIPPKSGFTEQSPTPQTTPKLPKRERLNSISRLLKNRTLLELSAKPCPKGTARSALRPTVEILVSSCSPTDSRLDQNEDLLLKCDKGFLSPNHLPFSPRLLSRQSPSDLSPSNYPFRSPLYSPDRKSIFLGRGSFGKVTLCKYKGQDIAVKILHNSAVREANLIGLRHPHLVEIYHVSELLDGTSLVFMEFAGHCNLQQVLDTKSELDFRRRLSFCIQTIAGIHYCHENEIVHGDVKPANVMVSPHGVCKLGDFGNSSRMDGHKADSMFNPSNDIMGTVAYAAPEVLKGWIPSKPSDIYSFGVLLWQVATREIPFAGEHPHVVIYKVVNYGTRPAFQMSESPILSSFAKVTEDCWKELPSQRIDSYQALSALKAMMQCMEDGN